MKNWNPRFVELIRASLPDHWGNWGLGMEIAPGRVGYVVPKTGQFICVADVLPGAKVHDHETSSYWTLYTETVHRINISGATHGKVTDPDTGATLEADREWKWEMGSNGSIASEFALSHESTLEDFGHAMTKNFDWLAEQAKSVQMGDHGEITQGFGVITGVKWAKSGFNIGSEENGCTFSIYHSTKVSVDMFEAMRKGSFGYSSGTKAVAWMLWPAVPGSAAPHPVPIAYTFASFEGKLLIPNWTEKLSTFQLILDNGHGGTFLAEGTLSYDTPAGSVTREPVKVSGGLASRISDIPLNATNLVFQVKGGAAKQRYEFRWPTPLGQWPGGKRHIDVKGVWGFTDFECTDREAAPAALRGMAAPLVGSDAVIAGQIETGEAPVDQTPSS